MMPRGTHCMQSFNVMAMRMFNLLKVRLYGQDRTKCQGDNCCNGAVITGKAVIKAACSTKVQLPRHLEREKKIPSRHQGRLAHSDTHCFHSVALKQKSQIFEGWLKNLLSAWRVDVLRDCETTAEGGESGHREKAGQRHTSV